MFFIKVNKHPTLVQITIVLKNIQYLYQASMKLYLKSITNIR
jgi:hypothetical protein